MSTERRAEWRRDLDDLRSVLARAQAERDQRRGISANGLPDWVGHECRVMTDHVNLLRQRHALPPVSIERIARVEQMAAGHVDYSAKFALYCAELARSDAEVAP